MRQLRKYAGTAALERVSPKALQGGVFRKSVLRWARRVPMARTHRMCGTQQALRHIRCIDFPGLACLADIFRVAT